MPVWTREPTPAGEGSEVPWIAPDPIAPAPGAFDALDLDDDETSPSAVTAPATDPVDAMRLAVDASGAAETAGDAPAPVAVATPDADRPTVPGREAVEVAPAAGVAAEETAASRAGWSGWTPVDGTAMESARFDGDGTAVIVIDDGWSPWYDQSNVVFDHDFSGGNDRWAGQWTWQSHGSWVADVASAAAPATDIIHLKVFGDGAGGAGFADIEEALQWSVRYGEHFGAAAVNLSLGLGNVTRETETMLSDELAALARQDIATTVAAGNAGRSYADGVNLLAADPHAIGVSAVDGQDRLTPWTQEHATLTDVAARGTGVRVDSLYGWGVEVAGTSFAAPYVAGTAARLQEAADALLGERLSPEEIVAILDASGRDVRGDGGEADGYAVADAAAAVDHFVAHHQDFADDAFVA
jgi:hypothetical protein